ncbi:myelin-oligodendrocyte glycoprotein-like [Excalfactoria chinensis]|uniref:myelin-oligodendrocyte glycoprotein-like n=1 Tax=Excalfactoria chinensis TaxID=46218 RepID=UPI003B3B6DA5
MGFTSACRHPSFSHPWRTLLAHLVALHLLRLGSAQFRVVAPDLHVTANVGQDVVLRCQLSPCKDAWSSDIRWIQHRSAGLVHHYQNGLDLEQMEKYKGRTELLRDGLSNGNLDLRITAVTSADSGTYICAVEDADGYAEAVVELEVSDPFSQIVHPWKVALAVVVTLLVGSSVVIIVFLLRMLGELRAEGTEHKEINIVKRWQKNVKHWRKNVERWGRQRQRWNELKDQKLKNWRNHPQEDWEMSFMDNRLHRIPNL